MSRTRSALRLLTLTCRPIGDMEKASAKRLSEAVGFHPLALDVLRALLDESSSATRYATWEKRLSSATEDHLSTNLDEIELPTGCGPAISEVFKISLEERSPLARNVLLLASGLAPVSIPRAFVVDVLVSVSVSEENTERDVEMAISELERRSLVRLARDRDDNSNRKSLEVHALVRMVVARERTTADRKAMAEAARKVLAGRFSEVDLEDMRNHEEVMPLVEHALVCADGEGALAAGLGVQLGILLQTRGDFAGARECYERALAAQERILGPEHPDTLGTLHNLAVTLNAQGDPRLD